MARTRTPLARLLVALAAVTLVSGCNFLKSAQQALGFSGGNTSVPASATTPQTVPVNAGAFSPQGSASSANFVSTKITTPPGTPTVTSVQPTFGPAKGPYGVSITGTGFTGATSVKFGTSSVGFSVATDSNIVAVAPAGTGTVDVTVTTPGGTSATSVADKYTFLPNPSVVGVSPNAGPASGNRGVTVTGIGFENGQPPNQTPAVNSVLFGGSAATNVLVLSDTTLTATAPPGTGTVDVTVATTHGTSPATGADKYTYETTPTMTPDRVTLTALTPNRGSLNGGTTVMISGTGFESGTAPNLTSNVISVDFGSEPASFTVLSNTLIQATAPAGFGTVAVTVTTAGGTTPTAPPPFVPFPPGNPPLTGAQLNLALQESSWDLYSYF